MLKWPLKKNKEIEGITEKITSGNYFSSITLPLYWTF